MGRESCKVYKQIIIIIQYTAYSYLIILIMNILYTTKNHLCLGCGVCKSICPVKAISMVIDHGEYRPQIDRLKCLGDKCQKCIKTCPGVGVDFAPFVAERTKNEELKSDNYIGLYKSLYTGFSCDNEIRYHSASGGIVTSFLLYLLDRHIIDGAIVTKYSKSDNITPEPFIARNREELVLARSSKYCPVSMEQVRSLVNETSGKFVLVGLPCHIQAFRKLAKIDSKFRSKVFGLFSIYCSSNRSFNGRDYLIKSCHIKKDDISYFAFRDEGCLGSMKILTKTTKEVKIPFIQYYGRIRSFFKPHRCLTCIDHYGELADVCFGDIHIKPYSDDHIGISSWIVRSNYWDNLFLQAEKDGYIKMTPVEPEILNKSQAEMLFSKKKRAKAVMNMDKLLGRSIAIYDKSLENPNVMDYVKEIVCHMQRFVGRRPYLWFLIKLLNKKH